MYFGELKADNPALPNPQVELDNAPYSRLYENFFASLSHDKEGCHVMFINTEPVSLEPDTLLTLPKHGTEITIANLPLKVNEGEVRSIFAKYGTIKKITSSKDKPTEFVVCFSSPTMAENALEMNGSEFKGKCLEVLIVKAKTVFCCLLPHSWGENEFRHALNQVGPGVERFNFRDVQVTLNGMVKKATVSYFNRQCAMYSFKKLAKSDFRFGHIKPSPSWTEPVEQAIHIPDKEQCSYSEALLKPNRQSRHPLDSSRLHYACMTCGSYDSFVKPCKEEEHKLISKEDYEILTTNPNAEYSRFPVDKFEIKKGDFIISSDAACGGREVAYGVVIRNSTMNFVLNRGGGPYPRNNCTSYDAEALALEFAIKLGLSITGQGKLFIFTDCLPVCKCFNTGSNISCGEKKVTINRELVNRCRVAANYVPWIEEGKLGNPTSLGRDREVKVIHVYREFNQAADAVAKRVTSRDPYVEEHTPIREICDILEEDKFLYRVIKKKKV